jgi:hypothetical protein
MVSCMLSFNYHSVTAVHTISPTAERSSYPGLVAHLCTAVRSWSQELCWYHGAWDGGRTPPAMCMHVELSGCSRVVDCSRVVNKQDYT